MNWLVFYASMVNQMMKEKLGTIITIWLAHHILTDKAASDSTEVVGISQNEADDINFWINTIGQGAAFCSVPAFGYITDKLSTGHELIFAYGLRCIAGVIFALTVNPKDLTVIWTLVVMKLAADLEEVVIDSLFSKRLPGDARAAMKSAQIFFGKLGHLLFVVVSLLTIGKISINVLIMFVALFDGSMVVIAGVMIAYKGFEEDPIVGTEALKKN